MRWSVGVEVRRFLGREELKGTGRRGGMVFIYMIGRSVEVGWVSGSKGRERIFQVGGRGGRGGGERKKTQTRDKKRERFHWTRVTNE